MSIGWRDRAACQDADTEWFFPPPSSARRYLRSVTAQYCGHCPVTRECLDDALSIDRIGRHGIWGGVYFNGGKETGPVSDDQRERWRAERAARRARRDPADAAAERERQRIQQAARRQRRRQQQQEEEAAS